VSTVSSKQSLPEIEDRSSAFNPAVRSPLYSDKGAYADEVQPLSGSIADLDSKRLSRTIHPTATSPLISQAARQGAGLQETSGPQKAKPSAHVGAAGDEANAEPGEEGQCARETKSEDAPPVTDTEGFADEEDTTADEDEDESTPVPSPSRSSGAVAARRRKTAESTLAQMAGSSSATRGKLASEIPEEEEKGNEADEEDNDWDGEDEDEESEELSEREEQDCHEGHEELDLSLAERNKDDDT